jgi:hypothetical protein
MVLACLAAVRMAVETWLALNSCRKSINPSSPAAADFLEAVGKKIQTQDGSLYSIFLKRRKPEENEEEIHHTTSPWEKEKQKKSLFFCKQNSPLMNIQKCSAHVALALLLTVELAAAGECTSWWRKKKKRIQLPI